MVWAAARVGRAPRDLAKQWSKLIRCIENGASSIDNNSGENAICLFVVVQRNWLFADTVGGTQASTKRYFLIETCKAKQVEPYRDRVEPFQALPLAGPTT